MQSIRATTSTAACFPFIDAATRRHQNGQISVSLILLSTSFEEVSTCSFTLMPFRYCRDIPTSWGDIRRKVVAMSQHSCKVEGCRDGCSPVLAKSSGISEACGRKWSNARCSRFINWKTKHALVADKEGVRLNVTERFFRLELRRISKIQSAVSLKNAHTKSLNSGKLTKQFVVVLRYGSYVA